MSKSFRHTPIWKDRSGSKALQQDKRFANKCVRRSREVPSGKAYRRYYNPWNIHDQISYCTKQRWNSYRHLDPDDWYKWHYRK